MRKSVAIILLCQFILSSLLLFSVKLFSVGIILNIYFWFVTPAMLVLYIISVFLSMNEKNVKTGIISSILFFACLKFVFSLKLTDGFCKTVYSYFYRSSVDSVLYFGYMNLEEISKIFLSFAEHPPIIIVLSVIELVTGLKFELTYSFLFPLIAPLIIMPIIYRFLRRVLKLSKSDAVLGLLLYNSNLLNFGYFPFGYSEYGFLLFLLSLYFLAERDRSSRIVYLILCLVNSMTYSISSYSLIFFVLTLYILQRLRIFTSAYTKLNSLDVLVPFITTLAWTMYRAISDLITITNIAVLFLGHLSFPELIHLTRSQIISDPYAYLMYLTYVGQGLLLLLGLFGLINIILYCKNKKNSMFILLWLLSGSILAFFAFGVRWLSLPILIIDYRFRFVTFFMLFIIPLTAFGFQRLKSTIFQISNRKISFAVIGIITFLIVFSPIGNDASTILRKDPILATEPIATRQWVQLSHFVSSYAPKNITFLGGGRARFLCSIGVIPRNRLVIERNPYIVINELKGPYFIALTTYNLYLPDDAWPKNQTILNGQFESINLRCNKYFDSGDVWLYYFQSSK